MKREATSKAKFQLLAADVGRLRAVGALESLWHFAATNAPRGDIGRKYADEQIELLIGWDGEPGALIAALVRHRWLDCADGDARLIVHDWSEHADEAVQRKLARSRSFFADGSVPKLNTLPKSEREEAADWYSKNPPPDQDTSKTRSRRDQDEFSYQSQSQSQSQSLSPLVPLCSSGGSGGNDEIPAPGGAHTPAVIPEPRARGEDPPDDDAPEDDDRDPPPKRRGKTAAPPELPPEDLERLRAWCAEKHPEHVPRLAELVEACLDHFRAKGERRADWVATCRTWVRNEQRMNGARASPRSRDRPQRPGRLEGFLYHDA